VLTLVGYYAVLMSRALRGQGLLACSRLRLVIDHRLAFLTDLNPGRGLLLTLYASNSKGPGQSIVLPASTPSAAAKRTGKSKYGASPNRVRLRAGLSRVVALGKGVD
jgi:hypothetical protein